MQWWKWVEASVAALLVVLLLALRFDTLRDRPDSTAATALRRLAPLALLIPATFLIGLLGP